MNRFILIALAVQCSCAAATNADDYLLRVDTIGYVDEPASEKAPKETVLRSIEVVARPESAFHSKVTTGPQTLVMAGNLRRDDDGGFVVQIRYAHSVDTGNTVPTEDGGREPVPGKTAAQTTVKVALGDSVTLGRFETEEGAPGKRRLKSKAMYVLVLTKYEPTDA